MNMKKTILYIFAFLCALGGCLFLYRYLTIQPLKTYLFPKAKRPLNIAHRGGKALWPENTLYAFEHAIKLGVDVLELDVHRTADGHIVVIHDARVDRTSNGSGQVERMTLAELKALDFAYHFIPIGEKNPILRGQNISIPTLDEIFHRLPEAYFNIEIKLNSSQFAMQVVELIRRYGLSERVLLASFHPEVMRFLRTEITDIASVATREEIHTLIMLSKIGLGRLHQPTGAVYEVPMSRNELEIVTPALVEAAHVLGQEVYVWTIDDSSEMIRLLEMGVDGVLTNRPDILENAINRYEYFKSMNTQSHSEDAMLSGFCLIKGNTYHRGDVVLEQDRPLIQIQDFEILDHAVTNQEYKKFIDATNHRKPLHWMDGEIPEGKNDHPVIYIDRRDAAAYFEWLGEQDGRLYRLPTYGEFEYASRGGLEAKKYPWGDDDPTNKANFDEHGTRPFERWQDYLKPSKWGEPNGFGLYGMAGNVWNMVIRDQDPATYNFKYRIEDMNQIERMLMGGSWARSAEYLRCGYHLLSFNVRHSDIGVRPVREAFSGQWKVQNRKVCALSKGAGKVFLKWALLNSDTQKTGFNVYRVDGKDRFHAGFRLNKDPVRDSQAFLDETTTVGEWYQYYIRPVDENGQAGIRSEWTGIQASENTSNIVASFKPLCKQGGLVPVFGDLTGDGKPGCVIRLDNGNYETSQDPGLPVQLEAFTYYGRSLWRKDICTHEHCYGSANNVPFNVWDMDGDGKDEIITRFQIGDEVFLAILDGLTGRIKHKTPWPEMVSDTQRSSTRIHLSIAYLDGKHPAVITQTGLYENEVFVAYDARLNKLWQFNSFGATSGSGAHKIEVADVNGDGKHEIFDGTTCLNPDGTVRWSIYKMHPDIVSFNNFMPDHPGMEVFYTVEAPVHAGIYMVDADTGKIIWKINREDDPHWTHAHYGWTANIDANSPGIECLTNRAGHDDYHQILFNSRGEILMEGFPMGIIPVDWDGAPSNKLLLENGRKLGYFDGKQLVEIPNVTPNPISNSSLLMVADLCGDFRDDLVLSVTSDNGEKEIVIVSQSELNKRRFISKTESLEYRLWLARNIGGGYPAIYNHQLKELAKGDK